VRASGDAPDCETFWMSLPSRMSSSFWFFDSEILTPSSMLTWRTVWNTTVRGAQVPDGKARAHLLAEEVTDLHRVAVVLDDAVDGEMGVNRAHFVEETLKPRGSAGVRPPGTDRCLPS
jgi:hypothetical protein